MRNTINQDEMTILARAQADKLRVMRRALKPIIGHDYVDNVSGHKVTAGKAPLWEMSIRPNQHLQPLQISRYFVLQREQFSDFEVQKALITRAAADIAQAEDAVILLGRRAAPLLRDRLHVIFDEDELQKQEGLWRPAEVDRPILETILAARKALQDKGQYSEYYVVVSSDLYQEAYTPLGGRGAADAPIYQIWPVLAKDGFLYSDALGEKSGVMFSLARGTISLSVPMDIWVDPSLSNDSEGRPRYRLSEQFRLVIDDPDARIVLGTPPADPEVAAGPE